jgi:hypothetical protein
VQVVTVYDILSLYLFPDLFAGECPEEEVSVRLEEARIRNLLSPAVSTILYADPKKR